MLKIGLQNGFLGNNESFLTILSHQMYTFHRFRSQEIQFLYIFSLPAKNLTLLSAWCVNAAITGCAPRPPPSLSWAMCFWLPSHSSFVWRGSNAYYSPGICPPITESPEGACWLPPRGPTSQDQHYKKKFFKKQHFKSMMDPWCAGKEQFGLNISFCVWSSNHVNLITTDFMGLSDDATFPSQSSAPRDIWLKRFNLVLRFINLNSLKCNKINEGISLTPWRRPINFSNGFPLFPHFLVSDLFFFKGRKVNASDSSLFSNLFLFICLSFWSAASVSVWCHQIRCHQEGKQLYEHE